MAFPFRRPTPTVSPSPSPQLTVTPAIPPRSNAGAQNASNTMDAVTLSIFNEIRKPSKAFKHCQQIRNQLALRKQNKGPSSAKRAMLQKLLERRREKRLNEMDDLFGNMDLNTKESTRALKLRKSAKKVTERNERIKAKKVEWQRKVKERQLEKERMKREKDEEWDELQRKDREFVVQDVAEGLDELPLERVDGGKLVFRRDIWPTGDTIGSSKSPTQPQQRPIGMEEVQWIRRGGMLVQEKKRVGTDAMDLDLDMALSKWKLAD